MHLSSSAGGRQQLGWRMSHSVGEGTLEVTSSARSTPQGSAWGRGVLSWGNPGKGAIARHGELQRRLGPRLQREGGGSPPAKVRWLVIESLVWPVVWPVEMALKRITDHRCWKSPWNDPANQPIAWGPLPFPGSASKSVVPRLQLQVWGKSS